MCSSGGTGRSQCSVASSPRSSPEAATSRASEPSAAARSVSSTCPSCAVPAVMLRVTQAWTSRAIPAGQ